MQKVSLVIIVLAPLVLICCVAVGKPQVKDSSAGAATSIAGPQLDAKPDPATDPPGIHNLMKVSNRIYSGSEPHGNEGFDSLAQLGVKTVISVDGAKPNLEAARKHGIRYVHIPIGYNGVPEEAALSLARAVKDVEAPIFVHCHHGKHRGPSAAAIACIASGALDNKTALQILERAGTSKDYKGLWRDVEKFNPPAAGTELPELVEVAQVDSLTMAMSAIDRSFDNIKTLQMAKWKVPADQPDLVPAQEALILQEALHETARNLADGYDEQFKTWLAESDAIAIQLHGDLKKSDFAAADRRFLQLDAACKQCHKQYRDN